MGTEMSASIVKLRYEIVNEHFVSLGFWELIHRGHAMRASRVARSSPSAGATTTSGILTVTQSSVLPRRKDQHATAACLPCRKRKVKCDAQRPVCTACRRRAKPCKYDAGPTEAPGQSLKRRLAELDGKASATNKIYRILQLRPEVEAVEILRRIRAGATPDSVLRLVENGDMLINLALIPDTRLRYEFPFITSMPAHLCVSGNDYLQSPLYELTSTGTGAAKNSGNHGVKPALVRRCGQSFGKQESNGEGVYRVGHLLHPKPSLIDGPPATPLPLPELDAERWYPEFWLRYQSSNRLYRTNFGTVFHAHIQLNMILNDLCLQFSDDADGQPTFTLRGLLESKARLERWHAGRAGPVTARTVVLPMHFKLHMHYFASLIRILNATVMLAQAEPGSFEAAAWTDSKSPKVVLSKAIDSLETLVRLYYLRHNFEQLDTFIVQPLGDLMVFRLKMAANCDKMSNGLDAVNGCALHAEVPGSGQTSLPRTNPIPKPRASRIHSNWVVNIAGDVNDAQAQRFSAALQRLHDMSLESPGK
ncbi:Galactosyl transferase [Paramyrothecium foliicola]|nr:Galactosyl transferase [Paramyrothecium foliicola]